MVIGILIGIPGMPDMGGALGAGPPPVGNCDGAHLDFSCEENSGHIVTVGL